MLKGFIEIFKTGTHTDSAGITKIWTDAELEQMVQNHNHHKAPIVLGHPQKHTDTFGKVAKLKLISIKMHHLGRRRYKVINDFVYNYGDKVGVIRKGLISDGGSLPRLFYPFMAPDGLFQKPFFLHDQNYQEQIGKIKADVLLFWMCWHKSVKKYKVLTRGLAVIIFLAVFLFGWWAYKNHSNKKEEQLLKNSKVKK